LPTAEDDTHPSSLRDELDVGFAADAVLHGGPEDLPNRRPHMHHAFSAHYGDESNETSSAHVFPTWDFTRTDGFDRHPPSQVVQMVRRLHDRCPTCRAGQPTARGGSFSQGNRPNPRTPSIKGFAGDPTDRQGDPDGSHCAFGPRVLDKPRVAYWPRRGGVR